MGLLLPPQITRHPDLHAPAHARRRPDNSPGNDRSLFMLQYRQREVRSRPADSLECEQPYKRG